MNNSHNRCFQIKLIGSNALAVVVFSQSFYSLMVRSEVFIFPSGLSPMFFQPDDFNKRLFHRLLRPFLKIGFTREEFLLLRAILLFQSGWAFKIIFERLYYSKSKKNIKEMSHQFFFEYFIFKNS